MSKRIDTCLEKECKRLWQNIVDRGYQQKELDLNSELIEVNCGRSCARCDFGWFKNDHYAFFDSIAVVVDDQVVSIVPVDLAKYMFLYLAQGEKPSAAQIRNVFNGVCIFFAMMKSKGKVLNDIDYKEYLGLALGFSPTENGLSKRLSSLSFYGSRWALDLHRTIRFLRNISAPFEFANLSQKRNQEILAETVLEVMGITLTDYRNGGSFNFLGLDIGKHYIDHCANRFEEFFQVAYALRKTFEKAEQVCEGRPLPHASTSKSVFIGRVLTGESLEISLRSSGYKDIEKTLITHKETYDSLLGEFKDKYESVATLAAINKHCVISHIIKDAELPDRFDTFEFVRSMLIAEYVNHWSKPSKLIFSEYVSTLKNDDSYSAQRNAFRLTHKEFLEVCRNALHAHTISLPKSSEGVSTFIKNEFDRAKFVDSSLSGGDKLKSLSSHIESAACTLFVALAGWRRTEFGFPMASLSATINIDILDNFYIPWRFNVNWAVPKTHGESKVNREITSYAYLIAHMASTINLSGDDEPALYRPGIKLKEENKFQSAVFIGSRVDLLWIDFIHNYSLFEHSQIDKYSDLSEIRTQLRKGLPIYEFNEFYRKTQLLTQYRNGTVPESMSKLFDERLSLETKAFLKDKSKVFNESDTKRITKELLADLPYPTPHAFRHIWAEAVLTRYRGDVGKVIRANFKHMDNSFFMAYLRNKETQVIVRIAERAVISKIVRRHFQAANEEYYDYAGGFQRYVSKTARLTKVVKPEDQAKVMEIVSDRVIGIKSNLWATCMLREGNQHRAKCAEDGIPQRRNAEPKFCLGCIHSDISEMNYEGILVSIKDDVAVCRNAELPTFFKTENAKTVRLALQRIKELKKNSGKTKYDRYIAHLEESLEMAAWDPVTLSSQ